MEPEDQSVAGAEGVALIGPATRALGAIAMLAIAGILASTIYEVISRVVFDAPTRWAYDLKGYLLCFAIFAALPGVVLTGGSVSVTLFLDMLPPRRRRAAVRVVDLVSGGISLVAAFLFFRIVQTQYGSGTLTSGTFQIQKWVLSATVGGGFLLAGAMHLARSLLAGRR